MKDIKCVRDIKIVATPTTYRQLKPGDLYTYASQDAIDGHLKDLFRLGSAIRAYIFIGRGWGTQHADSLCYLLTIQQDDGEPETADLNGDQAKRLFEAAFGVVMSEAEEPGHGEWLDDLRDVVHEIVGSMEPEGGDA